MMYFLVVVVVAAVCRHCELNWSTARVWSEQHWFEECKGKEVDVEWNPAQLRCAEESPFEKRDRYK